MMRSETHIRSVFVAKLFLVEKLGNSAKRNDAKKEHKKRFMQYTVTERTEPSSLNERINKFDTLSFINVAYANL